MLELIIQNYQVFCFFFHSFSLVTAGTQLQRSAKTFFSSFTWSLMRTEEHRKIPSCLKLLGVICKTYNHLNKVTFTALCMRWLTVWGNSQIFERKLYLLLLKPNTDHVLSHHNLRKLYDFEIIFFVNTKKLIWRYFFF